MAGSLTSHHGDTGPWNPPVPSPWLLRPPLRVHTASTTAQGRLETGSWDEARTEEQQARALSSWGCRGRGHFDRGQLNHWSPWGAEWDQHVPLTHAPACVDRGGAPSVPMALPLKVWEPSSSRS